MTAGSKREKVARILDEVARKHGVAVAAIVGPGQGRRVSRARMEACWRLFHEAGLSKSEIGRRLRRDHTTVIHALNRIAAELEASGEWKPLPKPRRSKRTAFEVNIKDFHMAQHRAAHINAYWREEGIEANARALVRGGRIVIESDLAGVRQ